jgi:hypothetical protein
MGGSRRSTRRPSDRPRMGTTGTAPLLGEDAPAVRVPGGALVRRVGKAAPALGSHRPGDPVSGRGPGRPSGARARPERRGAGPGRGSGLNYGSGRRRRAGMSRSADRGEGGAAGAAPGGGPHRCPRGLSTSGARSFPGLIASRIRPRRYRRSAGLPGAGLILGDTGPWPDRHPIRHCVESTPIGSATRWPRAASGHHTNGWSPILGARRSRVSWWPNPQLFHHLGQV